MSLIVEDGSLVANSNTYVSRAEYIAYALARGVTIQDNTTTDTQLIKASTYIDSKETMLKGWKRDRDQSMSYPRNNLLLEGYSWDNNEIPRQVIVAQMQLTLDINEGIDLYNRPQDTGSGIKRKRVEGVVDVEFAVKESDKLTKQASSMAFMSLLMENNGLTIALQRA